MSQIIIDIPVGKHYKSDHRQSGDNQDTIIVTKKQKDLRNRWLSGTWTSASKRIWCYSVDRGIWWTVAQLRTVEPPMERYGTGEVKVRF